jgi:Flp pilus assembly protein TadD
LQPEDPFVRLLLGMHWLKHGEPQLAIEELYLASQLDPTNPHIASQMGAAYEALGQTRTALQAYRLATELAPQDPTFWIQLARAGLRLEPDVEAVAIPAARRALQLDPHNASALDCLGFAYLLLEDRPMAQRFLLRALARDPNLAETHYHLGLFYVTGEDYSAARAAFQRAAQLDPGGPVGALALRSLENLFP